MKLKSLATAIAAVSALAAIGTAQASDGTVNFTGQINATTCVVSTGTISVTLPTVDTAALSAAGKTATPTQFNISLTSCPAASAVHALFEIGSNTSSTTGNLKNTGAATNVEIQLLNSAFAPINIATQANDGAGTGITTVAGANTLSYYAQYYATGAATAGTVTSSVTYSLVYN